MKTQAAFVLFAALVALPAGAQAPARPALRLFATDTRVTVDASGAITAVEPPAQFGVAVAGAIEAQVRKLRFEAPVVDGKAVPGATWVHLSACTAPVGDAYRLALKFRGNGPALLPSERPAPIYPYTASRAGVNAKYEVAMRVAPDGSAAMERATVVSGAKRYGREFEEALATWVEGMRFGVEAVDGKPVGAQLVQKVEFTTDGPVHRGGTMASIRQRVAEENVAAAQARAEASDTCALALKAGDADDSRMVSIGSPIRVSEAN